MSRGASFSLYDPVVGDKIKRVIEERDTFLLTAFDYGFKAYFSKSC